jgi:two-component system chemotaxis response regulator CheY
MGNYRVLIVEDSPTMRQMISFALKRIRGLEIVEAGDGVDGYKKLTTEKFDLMLTDVIMPVMDGLKLISLVRSREETRHLPIIVITTRGAEEDRAKAMALGANSYILKPIQSFNVYTEVRKLLGIEE